MIDSGDHLSKIDARLLFVEGTLDLHEIEQVATRAIVLQKNPKVNKRAKEEKNERTMTR